MKILITGGSGFIGKRLQKALAKNPENKVYVLVLHQDLDEKESKNTIVGDICDENLDISEFDVIYHLAAIANPRLCEEDKDLAWKTNVDGTRNIAEKIRPGARIVFMSSAHVYGDDDNPHSEDELPKPQNFYGLTKMVGEEVINYYSSSKNFEKTIFRLFNSYSADQPAGYVVPDVINKYKTQKEINVINPDAEIDLVHIDDVIEILVSVPRLRFSGTYNICSGKPMKISKVYEKIKQYTGAGEVKEKTINKKTKTLLGDNSKLLKLGFNFRAFSLP